MDLEAITSVIYNTNCPWKSRRFTIEYVEKNILYNRHNTVDTFKPDDHDDMRRIMKITLILNTQIKQNCTIIMTISTLTDQMMKSFTLILMVLTTKPKR